MRERGDGARADALRGAEEKDGGVDRGGGGRLWKTTDTCGQCVSTKSDQSRCAERRRR